MEKILGPYNLVWLRKMQLKRKIRLKQEDSYKKIKIKI